jgi:Cu(I)/Ag(I) efflux system membrane fusion protein/cobalt-zinc-cadmium efflux system membrane fusion protein
MNEELTPALGQTAKPDENHEVKVAASLPPRPDYEEGTGRGRPRAGVYLAVVVALMAGLLAGVLGHERLGHLFGLHAHGRSADAGGKKKLWTCSMHPQVIKEEPAICPICHMKLEPMDVVQSGQSAMGGGTTAGERRIAYWWDPMLGAASISDKPGKSAMGMELMPVYEDEVSAGTAVKIDPVVVQNMGVRVARVARGPLQRDIRAVGYLEEAQPLVRDVNLRVSGWVEKLYAATEGQHVSKGDKLFDLYSPEVQVAVEELIGARRASEGLAANADELARKTSGLLTGAARRKLELWGLDAEQIEQLAKAEQAPRTVTFTSPITGHLTRKMLVEGAAVKAGDMALQIVDHSVLWLDSQAFAQDLSFIRLGEKVSATVEGVPGKAFEGEVVFIHPHVDPQTRTAIVRMALPNPDLALRPGMYATAHIQAKLAEDALLVPREAVIDTGTRQVVFLARDMGHFEPRRVKLGADGGDGMVQVLEGLAPGETIVTSGQFLLDAESRMREAIQKHLSERLLAGGAAPTVTVAAEKPATKQAHVHEPVAISTHPATRPTVAEAPRVAVPTTTTAPSAVVTATRPVDAAGAVDAVATAYLRISQVLGAPQTGNKPIEVEPLVEAARQAAGQTAGDAKQLAARVATASAAMAGQPLAEQRRLFKPLSEAVIPLLERFPPSKSGGLYVAHCPMALDKGADWVQAGQKIANPYYATEMKQCGQIKRPIGK